MDVSRSWVLKFWQKKATKKIANDLQKKTMKMKIDLKMRLKWPYFSQKFK